MQTSEWVRLERWLVILVAAHSYGVFCGLTFFTEWSAAILGFEEVAPLFFARQAGVFHFVVATVYLMAYFGYGEVTILVFTKTVAFVFLAGICLTESVGWGIPASMVSDGLMGAGVLLVDRRRRRSLASLGPPL